MPGGFSWGYIGSKVNTLNIDGQERVYFNADRTFEMKSIILSEKHCLMDHFTQSNIHALKVRVNAISTTSQ